MVFGNFSYFLVINLEGLIGVFEGYFCVVFLINLWLSDEGFVYYMCELMVDLVMFVIFSFEDGMFFVEFIQGFDWQGFGDLCIIIVIFLVYLIMLVDVVVGFIVLGINF